MEEEDHFTQTQLPALFAALAAAAMAARLLPLQLSLSLLHKLTTLSSLSFCSLTYAYKRGMILESKERENVSVCKRVEKK